MKIINIPNIITSFNLISGCLAIYFGFHGQMDLACLYIVLGAVFDFFDGMTARALGVSGPIGKELDSLADVVTFGVAPSVLCYQLLMLSAPLVCDHAEFIALFSFIMAAFSALRLAKFNCDDRQTSSFIGMPTPANALFWIGLCSFANIQAVSEFMSYNPLSAVCIVLALMALCCFLLICEIPMFSFKFKAGHFSWAENQLRYTFLIVTVALIVAFALWGNVTACLSPIILIYILFSLFSKK